MKKSAKLTVALIITIVTLASLCVMSFAAKSTIDVGEVNAEAATSAVGESSVVSVQLGKTYANQYFTLETDSGVDPQPYQADENGNVEFSFEIGSSSKYELTLLDTGRELEPLTEVIATTTLRNEEQTEETQVAVTEDEKTETGRDSKSVIVFVIGMIICCSYLALSKVLPKMRDKKETAAKPVDNGNNTNQQEEIKTPFDDDEL